MAEPDDAIPRSFTVCGAMIGCRLDAYLSRTLRIGRGAARRLLEEGAVRVQGRAVGIGDKGLSLGEGWTVQVANPAHRPVPNPAMPLAVLAEGEGWIIVDKPAGVAVHPLRSDEDRTVLNAVVARYPQIIGVGEGGLRSGVVHRLDVETSGALLFATTPSMWRRLREEFASHRARKLYRAIVAGALVGSGDEAMDLVVGRHRPARVRVVRAAMCQRPAGARRCRLSWRALRTLPNATLVEVTLHTGFLHQIRVMMAELGHPVLGDAVYGDAASATRLMLHASSLRAGPASAISPDPPEFAALLKAAGAQ